MMAFTHKLPRLGLSDFNVANLGQVDLQTIGINIVYNSQSRVYALSTQN